MQKSYKYWSQPWWPGHKSHTLEQCFSVFCFLLTLYIHEKTQKTGRRRLRNAADFSDWGCETNLYSCHVKRETSLPALGKKKNSGTSIFCVGALEACLDRYYTAHSCFPHLLFPPTLIVFFLSPQSCVVWKLIDVNIYCWKISLFLSTDKFRKTWKS